MAAANAAAVSRSLLQSLQQHAARFAAEGVPLTGAVGAPALHLLLDGDAALRAACSGDNRAGGLDGGWTGQAAAR